MTDTVALGSLQATIGLNLQELRRNRVEAGNLLRGMSADMVSLAEQTGSDIGTQMGQGALKGIQNTARQLASGMRGAVRQAQEAVFGMTHDKADSQRLRALLHYEDDKAMGVPLDLANQRRDMSLQKITNRERLEQQRLQDARGKLGMPRYQQEMLNAQRGFDANVRGTENPETRGGAALLYQTQMQEILRRRNTESLHKIAPAMSLFSSGLSEGGSGLWNQFNKDRNAKAWEMISGGMQEIQQRRSAEEEESQKRMGEVERLHAFEFRVGKISLEEYRGFLMERLQALQEASPEWQKTYEKLYRIDSGATRQIGQEFRRQGADGVESMAQGIDSGSGMVKNALMTLSSESLFVMSRSLRKGVAGTFGDIILRTLTGVLSSALEGAVVSAFKKTPKASAGSGFVGSALGSVFGVVGGFLGFDDAANDSKARGWGWDFAKHFTRGIDSFQGQRGGGTLAPVAQTASANPITVHMHYTGKQPESDVQEMGRRIAWEVQKELRRSL